MINQATLSLIKRFEGFSHTIYKCPAGLDTIGYGHVVSDAEKKLFENGISEKEATDLLIKDCQIALNCVSNAVKVKLNDNQIGALVSLIYNIGCRTFSKSRGLKYINNNDFKNAVIELFDSKIGFVKIGDDILAGLVRRRSEELNLWNSNV